MPLSDWRRNNWLADHKASAQEIRGLLAVADRDLADAQVEGLSADSRFSLAYNAALQSTIAALGAAGYRVMKGESQHHRAIQSLAHTIGSDPVLISKLDKFRKKRNISDYEQAGLISNQEAKEMTQVAKDLRVEVEAWLRAKHGALFGS